MLAIANSVTRKTIENILQSNFNGTLPMETVEDVKTVLMTKDGPASLVKNFENVGIVVFSEEEINNERTDINNKDAINNAARTGIAFTVVNLTRETVSYYNRIPEANKLDPIVMKIPVGVATA